MRTIGDIIEAVQEQQAVTDEELRLTLLSLYYFMAIHAPFRDFDKEPEMVLRMRLRDAMSDHFALMKLTPAERLGANWTPGTPENTAQRARSKRVLAAFEKHRGAKVEKGGPDEG